MLARLAAELDQDKRQTQTDDAEHVGSGACGDRAGPVRQPAVQQAEGEGAERRGRPEQGAPAEVFGHGGAREVAEGAADPDVGGQPPTVPGGLRAGSGSRTALMVSGTAARARPCRRVRR